MKATEQYFPVVLISILYKMLLAFESVDEILNCDHSNKSYRMILCTGLFTMLYKVVQLLSPWKKSLSMTIQITAVEQYFPVVLFIMLYKVVLAFEPVDEILKCDHSNESYQVLLSCGAIRFVN